MSVCRLDFAKGSSSASDEIEQGSDGTLVAELRLMERIHRSNIASNTYEAVTCAARNGNSFHQCADLAGAGTIAEDEASIWTEDASDIYYGTLSGYLDSENANPFGIQCGSKRVGDGVVNAFDISVIVFSMFQRAPYNIPLSTSTIQVRDDMDAECTNKTTRADWQSKLATDACPEGGSRLRKRQRRQRRLSEESENNNAVNLFEHARIESTQTGSVNGTWYEVRIDHVQLVVEIIFDGVWTEEDIGLVNELYPNVDDPSTHQPIDTSKIELRWARKLEFLGLPSTDCSSIVNGVSGTTALSGNTLAVRQEQATSNSLLCAFSIFLYVPDTVLTTRRLQEANVASEQVVRIAAGTSWRQPFQVGITEDPVESVRSDLFFIRRDNQTIPVGAGVPPPPPTSNASEGGISTAAWVAIISSIVLVLVVSSVSVLLWFLLCRRKRDEDEESGEAGEEYGTKQASSEKSALIAQTPLILLPPTRYNL